MNLVRTVVTGAFLIGAGCHSAARVDETASGGNSATSAATTTAPAPPPAPAAPGQAKPPIDWNDGAIAWKTFDDGLAEAKAQKKPVMLLFYAEWCPHCHNYGSVFHDPKVVTQAKQFVMIRVDVDKEPGIDARFGPDGNYVPRTFFLKANGDPRNDIHMKRDKFLYFYDEHNAAPLLRDMELALK